jgi:hypothetical protein
VKKNYHLYLGRAGHLYAMSAFLIRGWNVAIPEVDIGDDIFVVQDENGILRRVQVKTATAITRQSGFSSQFSISVSQLQNLKIDFPVYYVFVVRHSTDWVKPIIIRQDYLLDLFEKNTIGSSYNGSLNLYFSFNGDQVQCSGLDFSPFREDYTDFPIID